VRCCIGFDGDGTLANACVSISIFHVLLLVLLPVVVPGSVTGSVKQQEFLRHYYCLNLLDILLLLNRLEFLITVEWKSTKRHTFRFSCTYTH
jgi:hypothetical protein